MDILDKIRFKLAGRKVQVLNVKDVDDNGRILSVQFEDWNDRPNTLFEAWEVKGAEKDPDASPIEFINHGVSRLTHVAFKGVTVNLYTDPMKVVPNRERAIGALSIIDIIGEILDMGKSMRNTTIGFIIGCLFWASIGGPMLTAFLS